VVKPEWGVKRTCNSCGAKFYDLRRDPIICPKCDATVDPVAIARSQRTKAPAPVVKEAPPPPKVKTDDADDDLEVAADEVLAIDDDDEDDDAAIEDVSELGEDQDDMLGVIDKVSDEGEETR
jgi:uncharacterized protein (TIGR02300 family)